MIGTIRINFIVGGIACVITFLLSVGDNLFLTTFLHSLYSFTIMFVLSFGFRFVLGVIGGSAQLHSDVQNHNHSGSHIGNQVDLTTPVEEEAARQSLSMDKSDSADSMFAPLNPPKLATKTNLDPGQLAGALRRMSED